MPSDPVALERFFQENPSVALGFSGGVDSSYLLYAGLHCGAKIKAYFVKTAFQPAFALRDAYCLAHRAGAKVTVLEADILENEQVASNPPDRCYHCKTAIFGVLRKQARDDGVTTIMDGTNASDDSGDRPGMRALSELSVRSPLRACGMTKDDVRRLSKEAGLCTWDKPAYACLATRIPTGRPITEELLWRVESAEDALFTMGFTDFRVRVYGEGARLQFPQAQLKMALDQQTLVIQAIKPYFPAILLDLEGR